MPAHTAHAFPQMIFVFVPRVCCLEVYRAAYSVTGNKHEAQDVQQDVFLKLIDDGRTLEFTANPAGYLYRMAINKALENYRKRERRNETDDGLEPLGLLSIMLCLISSRGTLESGLKHGIKLRKDGKGAAGAGSPAAVLKG